MNFTSKDKSHQTKLDSISVLSVPGLPNGFLSLDSRLYHDYEGVLEVIGEVFGSVPTYFSSYIWPREIPHSDYGQALKIPALAIPLYYLLYQCDAYFRKQLVDRAKEYILQGLEKGAFLFLILHSHGNRIALDALLELDQEGSLEGDRVVILSFAPAYKDVLYGYLPAGLREEQIQSLEEKVRLILNFRMKTDLLSGMPSLNKTYLFDPHWYEVFWLGHATIRSRKDVMDVLKKELGRAHLKPRVT